MADEKRILYLVDGSWIIFRAFHVLPPLTNSRGLPTGATYGFMRMLVKLLKDVRPTHIGVAFDSAHKTFRDDLFAAYKANRDAMPDELGAQIPYIHRAVEALGIKRIMVDGFEADDVIGTLAVRAAREGFNAVIITGDKDFKQLVSPRITLWDTMNDRRTGVREVRDTFGVEPAAVVDIMALTGDAIDNVKGLPGAGPKTANALIGHFGSLEALFGGLERLGEITTARLPKNLAEKIREHRAAIELARKLVRIDTDVALPLGPADLARPGLDRPQLTELLRELEFPTMLNELAPAAENAAAPGADHAPETPVTRDNLAAIAKTLARAPHLAFAFAADPSGAATLKLKGAGDARVCSLEAEFFPAIATALAAAVPPKACHDLKTQIGLAGRHSLDLHGVDFDTLLAGFLINPGKAEPSLADLCNEYLVAPGGSSSAAASAPAAIEALAAILGPRLKQDGLEPLLREIELPVARVLAAMEAEGVGVDAGALGAISAEFGADLERIEAETYAIAGKPFNLNSPTQLRAVLFDDLKLSARGLKKTKSGYSTDADSLEKLSAVHPLPKKIIEYRTLAKLKSTYSDTLPTLIDPTDGRIHTSFHQAVTATGRLSSTDPNLQNIPTRSPAGRRIRRAFVPRPGAILLSADYSQIELRILAHLSGDPTLIESFARDEDIHARTASEVLGIAPDRVDAEARRLAKVINFGIIYGMGPQRLAGELAIPIAEASAYIKRYFERLAGVRAWFDSTLAEARARGYVATMYGRRRYLPELTGPDGGARAQAERIAINTPIQGSAADLIKLAMVRLHSTISEQKLAARILLQVHDELLLEVPRDGLEPADAAVRREMEGVAALRVPLRVEVKSGLNWAEMTSR
ncbi:MAG TPA: DNA polymerase I [Candidatus Binataceae bacterium]|nr:DNA polymerase I [Candidatus Binataceae bacterium]